MIPPKKLVHEYQKLHKLKFGKDISPKDAEKEIFDLRELIRLVAEERKNHCDN